MKQDIVINRVLRDLKMVGLVNEDSSGEFRPFLNAIYVAAWEERGKAIGENIRLLKQRKINQYDSKGQFMEKHKTARIAARKAKHSLETIYKLLKSGDMSTKGHYWKYADQT